MKGKALPLDLNPEDSRNWDFTDLPKKELDACCLWEYARESIFVRDTLRRVQEWGKSSQSDSQKANAIDNDLQTIGNCQITPDRYFPRDILLTDGGKQFPQPWQSLTDAERQARVDHLSKRSIKYIGGFRVASFHDLNKFARALNETNLKACEMKQPSVAIEPRVVTPWGAEMILVEISWGRFSPDTIAESFRIWVKANQPKEITKSTGRPPGAYQPEAALDGLAIMRLLSHFKPAEAKTKAPRLWNRHKGKQLFRKRKEARKIFRKIFPLIPKDDLPLSWPTSAGR